MAKRQFRKVFFICENNEIFPHNYSAVRCYREEVDAKTICIQQQRLKIDDATKYYNAGKPIPKLSAHGFYLVHESLFDEILKKHTK